MIILVKMAQVLSYKKFLSGCDYKKKGMVADTRLESNRIRRGHS